MSGFVNMISIVIITVALITLISSFGYKLVRDVDVNMILNFKLFMLNSKFV